MTNKEAIEILWQYDVNFEPHPAEEVMHAIDMAINALTAQSETHACDCVSKISVYEILADIYPTDGEKVVAVKEVDKAYEAIQQLPSVQSDLSSYSDKLWRNAYERGKAEAEAEIIYCKDCVHHIDGFFCRQANHHTSDNDCCASVFGAERRTDE